MNSVEFLNVFFMFPSCGERLTSAMLAFRNFGSFSRRFASVSSEKTDTARTMHSSIPSPVKVLSGANFF